MAGITHPPGSPPRAWGGRQAIIQGLINGRLTPTCVGRTLGPRPTPWRHAAHPHVRGEDAPRPRTTRAGPAHPHVRGEDVAGLHSGAQQLGSPPRAWGGPHRGPQQRQRIRLTPTCVGRTALPRRWDLPRSAHPHVRGEDFAPPRSTGVGRGSPPRAWGGRLPIGRLTISLRLTPTCVGRTDARRVFPYAFSAHPHVRGEDMWGAPRR